MNPANEKILDVMKYIAAVGAYVEASIFLDPTFVGVKEFAISRSRLDEGSAMKDLPLGGSLLVRSLSMSLIGGRTIIQHYISFLTVSSRDDCVSMNCMEYYFPIVYDHNRLYTVFRCPVNSVFIIHFKGVPCSDGVTLSGSRHFVRIKCFYSWCRVC